MPKLENFGFPCNLTKVETMENRGLHFSIIHEHTEDKILVAVCFHGSSLRTHLTPEFRKRLIQLPPRLQHGLDL